MNWRFDPLSGLVGAVFTLVLVGIVYLLREPLSRGWQEVREGTTRLMERITAGVGGWYRRAVIDWAQQTHALSGVGPLDQILVSPELFPPPPQIAPDAVSPLTWEPIPLSIALQGHRRLMVVGRIASGRSTLLSYLALVYARREAQSLLNLSDERLPLYVHLPSVDWTPPEEMEEETAEAEPLEGEEALPPEEEEQEEKKEPDDLAILVREAIRTVGASATASGALRHHLQAGEALILIDGWDELSPSDQERATEWLNRLLDLLPDNLWIVAVGPQGFAPLAEADFVPLRLEPWDRPQVETFLTRLSDLLFPSEEEKEEAPPLREVLPLLLRDMEKEPARLDLALRAWLYLTEGEAPPGRMDLYMRALERLIDPSAAETWLLSATRVTLGSLALMMQREERDVVTRGEVEEMLEAALPPPEERPARAAARAIEAFTSGGGPLIPRGQDRYAFAHPLWQAILVARQMMAESPDLLVDHLDDPRWLPVLDFYAEVGKMEPVLRAWLSKPDDIWRTRLRTTARWASFAPQNVPWRRGVMATLARAFLNASLPSQVRTCIGEALARTGDPGVPVFLQKTMRHPEPLMRAAAARAMGELWGQVDLSPLIQVLADPEEQVKSAATTALANIGTPAAIRWLTQALEEGEEMLRVEAARGLAAVGGEGWDVLREAMESGDFLTRRAAAYGLGEVETDWAKRLLEHAAREDEEWIVQSAATSVLNKMETAQPAPPSPPPVLPELSWLISWAAERGEGVSMGEAAFEPLLLALQEGRTAVRRAAAQVLGMVGRPEDVIPLREAMEDPDPEVAQAALWALEEIARRHDVVVR